MSSGSVHIGNTRPRTSSNRAATSSTATGSPSTSSNPASTRLPTACPASAPVPPKRCWKTVLHNEFSPASAASALRRSPGGSRPSSRRSRPDDPPSSATVTIAVTSGVTRRTADNVACSPWPPPRATARTLFTTKVAVHHLHGHTVLFGQTLGELDGQRHAAVLAAGAADGQRQVPLALALVAGADQPQQLVVAVEELLGALLRE